MENPLIIPPGETFAVGSSDLAFFDEMPVRIECGAMLFCREGSALADINECSGALQRQDRKSVV